MIYDFECIKCGKVEEKNMKVADLENKVTCSCGENSEMRQKVSAPGLVFNGKWFSNSGGY